jgi:hypothetical protein
MAQVAPTAVEKPPDNHKFLAFMEEGDSLPFSQDIY